MSTSVGTITLDLVIKEQLDKQLGKIKTQIENAMQKPMAQAAESMGSAATKAAGKMSKSMSSVKDSAKKSRKEIVAQYEAEIEQMVAASGYYKKVYGEEIPEVAKKGCEQAGEAMEELGEKIKEVGNTKIEENDISESVGKDAEKAVSKMSLIQAKWQETVSTLANSSVGTLRGFSEIMLAAEDIAKKLKSIGKSAEESAVEVDESAEEITNDVEESVEEIENSAEESGKSVEQAVTKTGSKSKKTFSGIKTLAKGSFNVLKSVGGKALSAINAKFSGLKGTVNSMSRPLSKLGNSLKRAAKSALLMTAAYAAFRGLKSAITTACESNDEFAKSLNEIKANLNIAFQPIMTAIMPAINTLMSGLAQATKAIATFTAELFGSTYKKSLETVKQIKSVSKAAEKSSTYLNSYDVMNVASDTSSDSSDSSSDSDSDSSVDYSAISGEGVELPDWAEKMKTAIKSGDWAGVGKLLGERVNAALGKIDWKSLQKKVNSGAKKLAKALNSFVSTVKWEKLGKEVGNGINTILGAINTFINAFDWKGLGKSFANLLNGAIKATDWTLVGNTFGGKINAIINTLYGFVTNFDWSEFGTSLGTAVNGWLDAIDFSLAGQTLTAGISGIFNTASSFLETVDFSGIGTKIADFLNNIDFAQIVSDVATTVSDAISGALDLVTGFIEEVDWEGLAKNLLKALKNLVTGINWGGLVSRAFKLLGTAIGAAATVITTVATAFWKNLKKAFKATTSYFSKYIKESGGNVVSGLFNGIKDAIKNVGSWIKEHIFTPFINGFKKTFKINSPSKIMSEQGGFIMSGLLEGIKGGISTVVEKFKEVLKKVKDVFTNIPTWFKEKFADVWKKVKSAFSIESIKSHFTSAKNKVVSAFTGIGGKIKEKFTAAWKKIKEVFSKKTVKEHFSGIKDKIVDVFESLETAIKKPINAVIDVVNSLISGINSISIDIPSAVAEILGFDSFGFNIPEIPKLAKGGLATAPTLAMVGDNANASSDPEAILPISKLQEMLDGGSFSEAVRILSEILDTLKSLDLTVLATVDKQVLFKMVQSAAKDYYRKTGRSAF
jgi:phage-related protein